MYRYIILIALAGIFTGCKTISYDNAISSNEDKFYGEEEYDAIVMTKMKNYSLWAEDIAGLTEEKVYSKDLYDFGQRAQKEHKKFQFKLGFLAKMKGIKVPNSVNQEHQEYYRSLHKITDEITFDIKFMDQMEMVLDSLITLSNEYGKEGKDKKIRNLITKHSGVFEAERDRILDIQEYLENSVIKSETELSMNEK